MLTVSLCSLSLSVMFAHVDFFLLLCCASIALCVAVSCLSFMYLRRFVTVIIRETDGEGYKTNTLNIRRIHDDGRNDYSFDFCIYVVNFFFFCFLSCWGPYMNMSSSDGRNRKYKIEWKRIRPENCACIVCNTNIALGCRLIMYIHEYVDNSLQP